MNINVSNASRSISEISLNGDRVAVTELWTTLLLDSQSQNETSRTWHIINAQKKKYLGYNIKNQESLKGFQLKYRKDILLHKLNRIQKEFQFIKRNIKYYQELTKREKEIIQLIANGNNNPNIAEQLFISRRTVEQHRKNINCKLKIKSFDDLIHYFYAFDLV
jgi:DNA-binding CsgD family transcriptional regulator